MSEAYFLKKSIFCKYVVKKYRDFYKKPSKKIKSENVLNANIPKILDNLSWKKSMKWGEHNLYWGRPLKSILAIFDNKPLSFKFPAKIQNLVSGRTSFFKSYQAEKSHL